MWEVRLDSGWEIPIVEAIFGGSGKKKARGTLVFDTGSALTQIDVDLIETLGYSLRDAEGTASVKGATGEAVEGYIVSMSRLVLFGREFRDVRVLTYDFKNFPGIDGLLGWDRIRELHLELEGPKGLLKVF